MDIEEELAENEFPALTGEDTNYTGGQPESG